MLPASGFLSTSQRLHPQTPGAVARVSVTTASARKLYVCASLEERGSNGLPRTSIICKHLPVSSPHGHEDRSPSQPAFLIDLYVNRLAERTHFTGRTNRGSPGRWVRSQV